jgi:hypothetical protein
MTTYLSAEETVLRAQGNKILWPSEHRVQEEDIGDCPDYRSLKTSTEDDNCTSKSYAGDMLNAHPSSIDHGAHYRFEYKGIKLDPFRIAEIYSLNGPQLTILKKTLVSGKRGTKDAVQDYNDIISAANRAIQMIEEDS